MGGNITGAVDASCYRRLSGFPDFLNILEEIVRQEILYFIILLELLFSVFSYKKKEFLQNSVPKKTSWLIQIPLVSILQELRSVDPARLRDKDDLFGGFSLPAGNLQVPTDALANLPFRYLLPMGESLCQWLLPSEAHSNRRISFKVNTLEKHSPFCCDSSCELLYLQNG